MADAEMAGTRKERRTPAFEYHDLGSPVEWEPGAGSREPYVLILGPGYRLKGVDLIKESVASSEYQNSHAMLLMRDGQPLSNQISKYVLDQVHCYESYWP